MSVRVAPRVGVGISDWMQHLVARTKVIKAKSDQVKKLGRHHERGVSQSHVGLKWNNRSHGCVNPPRTSIRASSTMGDAATAAEAAARAAYDKVATDLLTIWDEPLRSAGGKSRESPGGVLKTPRPRG